MAKFEKGKSGNPSGRPVGIRNKSSVLIHELLDDDASDIAKKMIALAKGGDVTCIRLCVERMAPARRDNFVDFALPPINTVADMPAAFSAIAQAVAKSELTPSEAEHLGRFVESYAKAVEITDLERRIAAIETQQGK